MSSETRRIASDGSTPRPLPPTPRGLRGRLGRPVWQEFRGFGEYREVREHPVWQGEGIPDGRGRPVILLGGWMASPRSIGALAHVLGNAGWNPQIPAIGRNAGAAYEAIDTTVDHLRELTASTGEPVTVIGHSRGGQYARIIAVRHPELVASVVTVSARVRVRYPPFLVVNAPANAFDFLVRRGLLGPVEEPREDAVDVDQQLPFPVTIPYVSIWSRTDGLVDWRFCLDPAAHDIEVDATHLGICNSIEGATAVGEALRLIDAGDPRVRPGLPLDG